MGGRPDCKNGSTDKLNNLNGETYNFTIKGSKVKNYIGEVEYNQIDKSNEPNNEIKLVQLNYDSDSELIISFGK